MSYSVILSPRAFRQLGAIEAWIEQESGPAVARNYRQEIVTHCYQLESFPERGTPRSDLSPGLRTIVHRRRVTIAYEVEHARVVIVAIVGRGRDIGAAISE